MEGNCHFLEFPAYKTHAVRCAAEVARPAGEPAQASELSATAKLDSAHAAATLTRDAAHRNRLGKAGRCAVSARRQATSGRALRYPAGASYREASTVVLFSFRQMWYLHAIVLRSGYIQNSSCVDLVRRRLLRSRTVLLRVVSTHGSSFGGRSEVMR